MAFDRRVKCLDKETRSPEISELVESVRGLIFGLGKLTLSMPIWKFYPTKEWKIFENHFDTALRFK